MFDRFIKIPGKSFSDLSLVEVASMIEADSALRPNGNESFASCALDEFLHSADLNGRGDLEMIRKHILANIYVDIPGQEQKEIDVRYLEELAAKLRQGGFNAP